MSTDPASIAAFESALRADGYTQVLMRDIDAGTFNSRHHHDFDVRALMLAGELSLDDGEQTIVYRSGEIFTLAAGCAHTEQFGDEPARYLVGRRIPTR